MADAATSGTPTSATPASADASAIISKYAPGSPHNVTSKEEYNDIVKAFKDKVILFDFYATWCGPCKMMAPIIADWAKVDENQLGKDLMVFKIDVDELPDVAQEQGVRAMPTFILYKNEEKQEPIVGANKKALEDSVRELIAAMPKAAPAA